MNKCPTCKKNTLTKSNELDIHCKNCGLIIPGIKPKEIKTSTHCVRCKNQYGIVKNAKHT